MGQPLVLTLLSQAGSRIFPSFGDGVFMVVVRVQEWFCMLGNFVLLISLQETGICISDRIIADSLVYVSKITSLFSDAFSDGINMYSTFCG